MLNSDLNPTMCKKMRKEFTICDHGTCSVVQMSRKIGVVVSGDDWLQSNVLHASNTSKSKFFLVIIDNESFEKCVSMEKVRKLGLKMISCLKPYNLCWLQKKEMISRQNIDFLSHLQLESTTMMRYGVMLFV